MTQDLKILVFTLSGRCEIDEAFAPMPLPTKVPPNVARTPYPSKEPLRSKGSTLPSRGNLETASNSPIQPSVESESSSTLQTDKSTLQKEILSSLNYQADEFAEAIRKEIQKFLPPYITTQVSVQFEEGSILMSGAVALVSWAGSTALKTTKEEFEGQFSSVIKIVIQKLFSRLRANFAGLTQMEVEVVLQERAEQNKSGEAEQPSKIITPPKNIGSAFAPMFGERINWILIMLVFVLIIQMILIFDRFFIVSIKH